MPRTIVTFRQPALLVVVFAAMLVAPQAQPADSAGPKLPIETPNACPFEGCTFGTWTARKSLTMRRTRSGRGSKAFTLRAGEPVSALTGVLVIERAGRVEFRERTNLPSEDGMVTVAPGETLYLLGYKGEGFTDAWFKGKTYRGLDGAMAFFNALCDTRPERCTGRIVERVRSTWWVQIRNAEGLVGWTNQAEEFDGKDAFGPR